MFKWIYAQQANSKKQKSRKKTNLSYGPLEPRQLLATTATFDSGAFTIKGDGFDDDYILQVQPTPSGTITQILKSTRLIQSSPKQKQ